jgi:uncharacterized protein YjeT (DUF2065 family)
VSEESKTPKKAAKMTPLAMAVVTGVTGVVCVLLPSIAALLGQALLDGTRQMLEVGGAGLLVTGIVSARYIPTKGDGQ